jgi:hypothetical protein
VVVVAAAGAVSESQLGDGGHVDGVVEGAVPAPREPPDLAPAGGHLDGGGAVERGEAVACREAGDVAGDADHVAATTGPTPKMSMTLVPDAATSCSSRFFDSKIW